ncbi:hypothetical protein [Hyalangium sp.]|uniref:hypothetical protein n=1 Tax=Hyalangium sp. TaxID=2028555 RepID=UPI002D5F5F2A|nr:hypothetical protein [Hyalangium sp.]HYI02101.1 hypothetical protein [Hyalangium sp.]
MAKEPKAPPTTRAAKVFSALEGDDEFSVFSMDPRRPMVDLSLKEEVKPVATPLSRSIVRLFRKIFSE